MMCMYLLLFIRRQALRLLLQPSISSKKLSFENRDNIFDNRTLSLETSNNVLRTKLGTPQHQKQRANVFIDHVSRPFTITFSGDLANSINLDEGSNQSLKKLTVAFQDLKSEEHELAAAILKVSFESRYNELTSDQPIPADFGLSLEEFLLLQKDQLKYEVEVKKKEEDFDK
ncbi:hypothetical protein L1987_42743 [Smallanthus sonchifolius]|uniref:Uncharacterized protein n=1 Tax=Smallanthus sonchifolius TaxID=185202 RepID=A0ACB9GLP4_9ASTR|nr:hypothetical protein L1987_42743 [Smallanthus sonchifolius]